MDGNPRVEAEYGDYAYLMVEAEEVSQRILARYRLLQRRFPDELSPQVTEQSDWPFTVRDGLASRTLGPLPPPPY